VQTLELPDINMSLTLRLYHIFYHYSRQCQHFTEWKCVQQFAWYNRYPI